MIGHLCDCIAAYLTGRRTLIPSPEAVRKRASGMAIESLDKAFGLVRPTRGRPSNDPDDERIAATEVLTQLLGGATLEVASESVSERRREAGSPLSSDTQVADAWAKHKVDALTLLRLSRTDPQSPGWSEAELTRLREIYADTKSEVPGVLIAGVILPGERQRKGRSDTPENSDNKAP